MLFGMEPVSWLAFDHQSTSERVLEGTCAAFEGSWSSRAYARSAGKQVIL